MAAPLCGACMFLARSLWVLDFRLQTWYENLSKHLNEVEFNNETAQNRCQRDLIHQFLSEATRRTRRATFVFWFYPPFAQESLGPIIRVKRGYWGLLTPTIKVAKALFCAVTIGKFSFCGAILWRDVSRRMHVFRSFSVSFVFPIANLIWKIIRTLKRSWI